MIKITERINKNNNTSTNNDHKWLPYSVFRSTLKVAIQYSDENVFAKSLFLQEK